jgi:molybdate transport system substrate-binding protein
MLIVRTGILRAIIVLLAMTAHMCAYAAPVKVAVASNFAETARELARAFERKNSEYKILISSASTGKLYAQIVNGAPFDIFLSADAARAEKLAQEGFAKAGSLRTYATGQLLMVSRVASHSEDCKDVLTAANVKHEIKRIAIGEPRIAPYGKAAKESLQSTSQWQTLKPKFVRGENISQTLHFYITGNAQVAFIAQSQASFLGTETKCSWPVPTTLHQPIEQKMVVLKNASKHAQAFADFLAHPPARELIRRYGYQLD